MCYSLYITCLLQLKVFSKLLEVAKKLPGHKANVSYKHIHTCMYMYVHLLLCS